MLKDEKERMVAMQEKKEEAMIIIQKVLVVLLMSILFVVVRSARRCLDMIARNAERSVSLTHSFIPSTRSLILFHSISFTLSFLPSFVLSFFSFSFFLFCSVLLS